MHYVDEIYPVLCTECRGTVAYSGKKPDAENPVVCNTCTQSQLRVANELGLNIRCGDGALTQHRIIAAKWGNDASKWEFNIRTLCNVIAVERGRYKTQNDFPELNADHVPNKENT